jgi:four helix bundle protein
MTEAVYSYRNLVLWQKAQEMTLQVVKLVAALPRDQAAPILGRQVLRSAASVAANIAEGHGRFTLAAHRNHLSIARGSACETDGWLDLLRRAGYLDHSTEVALHEACSEIIRMLTAKILDLERKEQAAGKRVREETAIYDATAERPVDGPGSGF